MVGLFLLLRGIMNFNIKDIYNLYKSTIIENKNKNKNKKKKYLRYVIEHLKKSNDIFVKSNDYKKIEERTKYFKQIKEYHKCFAEYDNENFANFMSKFLRKKIKIKNNNVKDYYLDIEFNHLRILWKEQLIYSFISSIQGKSIQSMILINTLESYFRLIAKYEKLKIIKNKKTELYNIENHDSSTSIVKKLYEENNININLNLSFVYHALCIMNIRHKYCHGDLENDEYLSYICLMIIYSLFFKD